MRLWGKRPEPEPPSPWLLWVQERFTYNQFIGWCCHECVLFTPWPTRHLLVMHPEIEMPDYVRATAFDREHPDL